MADIFHLADIHIGSRRGRNAEYRAAFDKVAQYITERGQDSLIIIAGDIFHNKDKLRPEDIDDFYYMLRIFSVCSAHVIIVPGNHDCNLNNDGAVDLISPLLVGNETFPNVHYYLRSGRLEMCGHKFYHYSVYDHFEHGPADAELEIGADEYIIYHGHVTKEIQLILSRARGAIMGDIHQASIVLSEDGKYQCYPGSLIKQNFGDVGIKGFIHWQNGGKIPSQVPIESEYGFVEINLVGAATVAEAIAQMPPLPKYILAARIVTNSHIGDDDLALIEEAIKVPIKEMRMVLKSKTGGVTDGAVSVAEADVPEIERDTITTLVRQFLVKQGCNGAELDDIMALHQKYHMVQTKRNWEVLSMRWGNVYCYGPENELVFDALRGIVGVIAPNRAGKSTIFDILMLGLFGHYNRGNRASMIRLNVTERDVVSFIHVTFRVNGQTYRIERTIKPSRCHAVLKRFEGAPALHELSTAEFVVITEASIPDTYAYIKNLMGTQNDFLATAMCSQDATNDFVKMVPNKRRDELARMLGMRLDELETGQSISAGIKANLKKMRAELLKWPLLPGTEGAQERIEQSCAAVTEHENRLAALEFEEAELATLIGKLNMSLGQYEPMRHKMMNKDKMKTELAAQKARLAELNCLYPPALMAANLDIEQQMEDKRRALEALKMRVTNIAGRASQLADYKGQADKLAAEVSRLEDAVVGHTTALHERLDTFSKSTNVNCRYDTIEKVEQGIQDRLTRCEIIREQIRNMDKYSQFMFSTSCDSCLANKRTIAGSQVPRDKEQLQKSLNIQENWIAGLKHCQKVHNELMEFKVKLEKARVRREEIMRMADAYKLTEEEAALPSLQEIRSALKEMDGGEKFKAASIEIKRLRASIVKIEGDLEEAAAYANDGAKLAQIEADLMNARSAHDFIKFGIAKTREEIVWCKSRIGQDSELVRRNADREQVVARLEPEIQKHEKYLGFIDSKKIHAWIVEHYSDTIVARTNEILSQMTDFVVSFDLTEKDVLNLYIHQNGSRPILIELASGSQRFMISIALRLVFSKVLPSNGNFLCIDEGFGCLDKENMVNVREMLEFIAPFYKFIILVSHIEEMQQIVNMPIHIVKNELYSRIDARYKMTGSSEIVVAPNEVESESLTNFINDLDKKIARKRGPTADLPDCVEDRGDKIYCRLCNKEVKKNNASKHLTSKTHLKNV